MASRVEFMPQGMGDEPQQQEQQSGQSELTDGSGNASGENRRSKEEKEAMREYQKLQQMEVAKVEAVEPDLYYYHTDHLGSTTFITDRNGDVAQYLAYTPYGETFIEERDVTPYKFNGKELDAETGYYYYGARYYDPSTALWLGVDPLQQKYPGVSPYVYCAGNPVKYVDPDGREIKSLFYKEYDNIVAHRYADDKNAKILFAHGYNNAKGLANHRNSKAGIEIKSGTDLSNLIDSEFGNNNNENETIILMVCHGAEDFNGIAQALSKERPNSIVIGATDEIQQNAEGKVNVLNGGDWLILKDGKEIDRYEGSWQPKSQPTKSDYLLYNKKDSFFKRFPNVISGKNENNWHKDVNKE